MNKNPIQFFAFAFFTCSCGIWAQPRPPDPPIASALDDVSPRSLKASDPASTYTLSGFDNLNYFSGALSFNLPLLKIGGRGEVGYTMQLGIKPPAWNVQTNFTGDTVKSG